MYGKTVLVSNSIEIDNILQQRITVTGKVVEPSGEPIIGATVIEKENRANGTVSDENGNFSLEVANNSSLVISFIGYRVIEIRASQVSNSTITMSEDIQSLDELVVTGYTTQKKADLLLLLRSVSMKIKSEIHFS